MAIYEITTEDGKVYEVETEDASPKKPASSFQELSDVASSDKSLKGKAWDMLNVPSQMASRGLNDIAQAVPQPEPTGNLPMDLIKGTPRIAAETLAEAAPKFIDRTSMLVGGGAKLAKGLAPLANAVGRGMASQAEQVTGAVPGSVGAAFNDPTLMMAAGKKAASPLYQAAKAELPEGVNLFKGMYKPEQIVDTAKDYLSKGGTLEPAEALMYRKAIDQLLKSGRNVKDELYALREEADAMAKASDNIAAADPVFQRGRYADSLRNLLPQNKHGGASAFKMGIMAALEGMGVPGKIALAGMSPAAVGTAATAAGVGTRAVAPVVTNPAAAVSVKNLIQQLMDKYNKDRIP